MLVYLALPVVLVCSHGTAHIPVCRVLKVAMGLLLLLFGWVEGERTRDANGLCEAPKSFVIDLQPMGF